MNDSVLVSERALMRLTLELASLIEGAKAETWDADMAMKWLQEVAAVFGDLPDDAQRRLMDVAEELAAEYRHEGWTDDADFFDASAKEFGFGRRER
jgi:hypothetical protein